MSNVAATLDEIGRPAWIALMVLSFIETSCLIAGYIFGLFLTTPQIAGTRKNLSCLAVSYQDPISQKMWIPSYSLASFTSPLFRRKACTFGMLSKTQSFCLILSLHSILLMHLA